MVTRVPGYHDPTYGRRLYKRDPEIGNRVVRGGLGRTVVGRSRRTDPTQAHTCRPFRLGWSRVLVGRVLRDGRAPRTHASEQIDGPLFCMIFPRGPSTFHPRPLLSRSRVR